ncbi:hypothetical protein SAMN05216483_5106 [Streptomyces sp. 2131.1]|nr:hypothetical protein SAMN05216483_5106 [Streptomyces sp. 2131.1]
MFIRSAAEWNGGCQSGYRTASGGELCGAAGVTPNGPTQAPAVSGPGEAVVAYATLPGAGRYEMGHVWLCRTRVR